ncbi:hypothetical protein [Synechococcus sp. A15-127]|uniref:hypothetical protein n=1 Tax=Synechococcus sp. A15-127 TaxID=1050624 RepID=UPI001647F5DE|nr:hypothetical protein [Synechococcus sp. A15-127]
MFHAAPSLATVLAEPALRALRLLEGSPLPAGRCIHRKQTFFSVQIYTDCGLRLQHCLEDPKAVVWSTAWLTRSPAGKALTDKQLWRDCVASLTRNRVDNLYLSLGAGL